MSSDKGTAGEKCTVIEVSEDSTGVPVRDHK